MMPMDRHYALALLEDPRRSLAVCPQRFVDAALGVLFDAELRQAQLDALVARRPELPRVPDEALAARLADEGVLALEPETLAAIFDTPALLAAVCTTLAAKAQLPLSNEMAMSDHDDELGSDAPAESSTETDAPTGAPAHDEDESPRQTLVADSASLRGFAALERDLDSLVSSSSVPTVDGEDAEEAAAAAVLTGTASDSDAADDDEEEKARVERMVHARDPDSVLFNLKTLARVKSDRSAVDAEPLQMTGSGLLDIKSVAAVERAAAQSDADERRDVWSAAVLPVPTMLGTRRSNTGLKIAIGVALVAVLGLVVVLVVFLSKDNTAAKTQATAAENNVDDADELPALGAGTSLGSAQVVAQNDALAERTADEPATATAAAAPTTTAAATDDAATGNLAPEVGATADGAGEPAADGMANTTAATETAAAAAAPADTTPSAKSDKERRSSSSSSSSKKTEKKESGSGGGSGLSKADVQATIRTNFGKIRTCSRDAEVKGKLLVTFSIKADGRVTGASIASDEFKGTRVGACVIKVVEDMKFPSHSGDPVPVTYPFAIN